MNQAIKEVLYSEEDIKKRVAEMGIRITKDYMDRDLMVIGILKGSVIFLSDLIRVINLPILMDFMSVSSYGTHSATTGEVRILKDLDFSVEGRDVLIVEDIVDTGTTLNYLMDSLSRRGANSVEIAAFLDKKEARTCDVKIRYVGYEVPNDFIVGYGLDYSESYRNLPYVASLKEEIYK
ncbi:MAG: hypoxanthine phosphoribosyltransferase [Tissierellia bacterium]|nr:hypoxanthine phosphoribosyltransferase [Tissierellia bacterium]